MKNFINALVVLCCSVFAVPSFSFGLSDNASDDDSVPPIVDTQCWHGTREEPYKELYAWAPPGFNCPSYDDFISQSQDGRDHDPNSHDCQITRFPTNTQ